MVDINLLQEEPPRSAEMEERKARVAEGVGLEVTGTPVEEEAMDFEHKDIYRRKGRGSIFVAIAGGILILILAFVFFKPKFRGKAPSTSKPAEEAVVPEAKEKAEITTLSASNEKTLNFFRGKVDSTASAVSVVKGIVQSAPADLSFTLISLSAGNFFVESLIGSEESVKTFSENLKRSLVGSSFEILSEDEKFIGERRLKRVTFTGEIATAAPSAVQLTRINYNDQYKILKGIEEFCKLNNLTIKKIQVAEEMKRNSFKWIPLSLEVFGNRDAVVKLLVEISKANRNLYFSRIFLASTDWRDLSNRTVNLVLDIDVYLPA